MNVLRISFREIKLASFQYGPNSFFEDNTGTLWMLNKEGKLFFHNDEKDHFENYTSKWPGHDRPIHGIGQERSSGVFWFTDGRNLSRFDPKSSRSEKYDLTFALRQQIAGKAVDSIEALYVDRNEHLWLAFQTGHRTWKAKYVIASGQWSAWKAEEEQIVKFITTRANLTWSMGTTLSLYTRTSWDEVKSFGELPYAFNEVVDSVYCVAEDRDGANWVGTDNGVFVFTPSIDKFKYWSLPGDDEPQRFFPLGGRYCARS